MSLFGKKEKEELAQLRETLSPEQATLVDINTRIQNAQAQLAQINQQGSTVWKQVVELNNRLQELQAQIVETEETVLLQSFGMYTPHYRYSTSDEYKEELDQIRKQQKEMIKNGVAVTGNYGWTVNGNASQGKQMVKDMQKLLLRAFNAECDDAIEHVKFNNIEACQKKIRTSAEAISKLGRIMDISVTQPYARAKMEELHLMHEFQQKKQAEKEAAKEARARQREEAKAAKELEEQKHKLEKEQSHYANALSRIEEQIRQAASQDVLEALNNKKAELEKQLSEVNKGLEDVDYRAANQKAGYVYIISNVGAFGENVYKIGMTRRLEPMDRIDELGDASVPFDFDVHALIFTDDAPALEAALHNAFADRKVNCINQRREFFYATLDEIKAVVKKNYDKTVEFVDVAPAEQFRESLALRKGGPNKTGGSTPAPLPSSTLQ